MDLSPWSFTFLSAELFFLLVRSRDIKTLAKAASQRTSREQHRVRRGLARSILLEAIVFVPTSAVLLLFISPFVVATSVIASRTTATYALLGIASYGFPFATVKAIVTRAALNTLKEFAALAPSTEMEDENV